MLILIGSLVILVCFSFDDRFYVTRPAVFGNQRVDADDVVIASDLEDWHVAWVQPDRTAQMITNRLPGVQAAAVACTLPAYCTITIEERQPAFVWRQGEMWVWVDAEGVAFTARNVITSSVPSVPVVDMPPGSPGRLPLPGTHVDGELVSSLQALVRALPDLEVVRYTEEYGWQFLDPSGGWIVYMGSGPGMEARVAVWQALSEELARQGIRPTYVDVRYALAPYYALASR